jgi:pimeloyl-ACP methyl ester carboxylesterase
MKILLTTLVLAISSLFAFSTQAQYSTYLMPTPNNLSPFYVGPLFNSGVYYGATPPNLDPKKPVLVFVHGFTDLGNGWFIGSNDMYGRAYSEGFNTVFVAMTRGQGMYTNGDILAQMLDMITARYNVNDVVIVAHSNGGKASEVAMIVHNRKDKVERVISLGTPFGGTPLANLAEVPGANLIASLVGLGGGTSTSTTYFMRDARRTLDGSSRNQPGKFINYGGHGYGSGWNPAMVTSGLLLNTLGAGCSNGGNDGVTPYWSSKRPGGRIQWPGCSWWSNHRPSDVDHLQISNSNNVWGYIRNAMTASLSSLRQEPDASNGDELTTSRMQLLLSEQSNSSFVVEADVRDLGLIILRESERATYTLEKQSTNKRWEEVPFDWSVSTTANAFGNGYTQQVNLSSLEEGRYRIQSGSKFVAVVYQEKGVALNYDNNQAIIAGEVPTFEAWIDRAEAYDLSKMSLKAVITYKNTLEGVPVSKTFSYIENFKVDEDGNAVLTPQQHLPAGVYNMVLQAEHPEFQRTLITGFVVREAAPRVRRDALVATPTLEMFPNPASRVLTVAIDNQSAAQLSMYDVQGRLVYQQLINSIGEQQLTLNLEQLNIGQGTYFVELSEGEHKITKAVVVSK